MNSISEFKQANTIYIPDQCDLEKELGDWTEGRFAWQLQNITPLTKPLPFRGSQGLSNLPDDAISKILELH